MVTTINNALLWFVVNVYNPVINFFGFKKINPNKKNVEEPWYVLNIVEGLNVSLRSYSEERAQEFIFDILTEIDKRFENFVEGTEFTRLDDQFYKKLKEIDYSELYTIIKDSFEKLKNRIRSNKIDWDDEGTRTLDTVLDTLEKAMVKEKETKEEE